MKAEHRIQQATAEYLGWCLPPGVWWSAVDAGAFGEFKCDAALRGVVARFVGPALAGRLCATIESAVRQWLMRRGAEAKRRGVKRGVGDFILCHQGRLIVIEMKAPSGRLSVDQVATQAAVLAAGGVYVVAHDVAEVDRHLREAGIALRGRLLPFAAVSAVAPMMKNKGRHGPPAKAGGL